MIEGSTSLEGKTPEGVVPALPAPGKPKMLRRIHRRKYCQVITVREGPSEASRKTEIPASARDNRLSNVIASSKLRNLIEKTIDTLADRPEAVGTKELLEVVQALDRCAEISYRAHGDKIGKDGVPDLPPANTNRTNINTVIIGGGQSEGGFGNMLDAVGSAAKKAQTPVHDV